MYNVQLQCNCNWLICQDAVHRLQFSIQHNHPSAAHSQIGPAGAQHLSVQLVVGLSDRKTSGRQYGSALTHPAPSHWTQGPPKDVCWAPSSSLCWSTTAHRHTTLIFSSSLRMTRLWWVSSATEMRQTTGARWAAWLGGAGSTISLWMWRRRRRLLLTSGECTLSMLLWPSTVWLWRERAAPSSWVCTSQTTSPGLTTLQHWPRKHSSVSTSSANSEEPDPRPPSCALSTEAPSRASWLAAVWYGACNASCRKSLQRIVRAAEKIVGVSLPSLQNIYGTRLTRKALSIAGDPTHPTHSFFSLLPSGRRLRSLQARTSRLKDSFIHQAVRKLNSLTSLPPLPSFTPRNTELWHYDPPPQCPPPSPPPPPPPYNCDPHQSLCAALECSLPHPALSVIYLFWQSDKRLFFSCTTLICTVLVYLTGLHSICHVPYATLLYLSLFFFFFFFLCPHLYICIVCMYIWLNCIYLYLNVYCQCLMLTVCTKGLRVTQFQFSVCMYCTCGRIDNKADLTWLD